MIIYSLQHQVIINVLIVTVQSILNLFNCDEQKNKNTDYTYKIEMWWRIYMRVGSGYSCGLDDNDDDEEDDGSHCIQRRKWNGQWMKWNEMREKCEDPKTVVAV